MNPSREKSLELLKHEARSGEGWLRIHAGDALLDHHEKALVKEAFSKDTEAEPAKTRIGLWRMQARAAASSETRQKYIELTRQVMLDPKAPDRLQAIESLCKLDASNPIDRPVIRNWIDSSDDATAAFPRWFLVASSTTAERAAAEEQLATLLDSHEVIARLRVAYAIGRISRISSATQRCLATRLKLEPANSIACVHIVIAALRHATEPGTVTRLRGILEAIASSGDQGARPFAAAALGQFGTLDDVKLLSFLLQDSDHDTRIGAANGLLYLITASKAA